MTKSLRGQVAMVTGASGGIGRAIAMALAADGVAVYIVSRQQERLDAVAHSIRETQDQSRVWVSPADLGQPQEIEHLKTLVERESGHLDILVHCAGMYGQGALNQVSADEFDKLYEANVRAPFALTNAFLPILKARRGQLVFVNSSAGLTARAGAGQFSATQHALRAMANTFREELNSDGVRVLNMFLGRTATPRMQALYQRNALPYQPELLMQPEDVAAMTVSALSLPRTAEVTEIHMRPLAKSY